MNFHQLWVRFTELVRDLIPITIHTRRRKKNTQSNCILLASNLGKLEHWFLHLMSLTWLLPCKTTFPKSEHPGKTTGCGLLLFLSFFLSQCKAGKVDTSVQSGKVADIKARAGIQLHFIPCVSHSWNQQIMKGDPDKWKRRKKRQACWLLAFFFLREINPVKLHGKVPRVLQGTFRVDSTHPKLCFPRLVFPSSAFPF